MNKTEYIEQHFPQVDPGVKVCGAKVLIQLRTIKEFSSGGIALAKATTEFNNGNTRIGRLVAVGGIAFCDRNTGQEWKEGKWAEVGDIVIMPAWGGFRFEVPIPGQQEKAIFTVFDDTNVQMVVESNFETFDQLL